MMAIKRNHLGKLFLIYPSSMNALKRQLKRNENRGSRTGGPAYWRTLTLNSGFRIGRFLLSRTTCCLRGASPDTSQI
jgi:hypothetical protein